MSRRVLHILVFLAILVPSIQYVWQSRDMPHFSYLHDDGLLFVSAKSLSEGSYRIDSFPDAPPQTKFPPLFPAYLSLIWKLDPNFPHNLRLGTLFAWIPLAAFLFLARMLYRKMGLSDQRAWLLVALLGMNPYLLAFGGMLFSDVFFTCWLLAVVLAAEESPVMAALAGVLAACAYLSRTAGILLLVSVPVAMFWHAPARWKEQGRRAAVFAAAMLPAVIAWSLWTRANAQPSTDSTTLYYTDYMHNLMPYGLKLLPTVLWKNFDQLLYSMGSMIVPRVFDAFVMKILTQVVGVAMIAGTTRLVRRGGSRQYAAFALISSGLLLIWNYPPTERFVVPIYPLLLAGLVVEIEHLWKMLRAAFRKQDTGERMVAWGFASAVVLVFGIGLALQVYMTFFYPRQSASLRANKLRDQRAAYQWISNNLPPSAKILSYEDPLLYLYTGRRGNYLTLDPLWWYTEDHDSIRGSYRDLVAYCKSHGLEYVYFTSEDLSRETGDEDRTAVQALVRANHELTQVFQAGIGTIYRVGSATP